MPAENIGSLYNTKIPAFEDNADIQAALKVYHYGSLAYDTSNTDPEELPQASIASYLYNLQVDVDAVEARKVGSSYQSIAPTQMSDGAALLDGYIWVNKDSDPSAAYIVYSSARYQNSAPTEYIVDGTIWVDKDSTHKTIYVYDAGTSTWVETSTASDIGNIVTTKGDILVADSSGNLARLAKGTDQYVLTADSSSTLGVKWSQTYPENELMLYVMGVF